jgi:peptidoglycan/LPS O-acetylase OafA/YrhL
MNKTPTPKPPDSFTHLNMARGLAAFAVLLGHLRSFVFYPYGDLEARGPLEATIWAATGFGHQAVMIFFVLSGFFITRSIIVDNRRGGFSWTIYLIKRLTRLWVVLIPCLILTLICDKIGMIVGRPSFYSGQFFSIYNSGPSADTGGIHLDLAAFFGNLFFLQGIVSPIFGSNGPLWSLSYEFWYYLMFPCLYLIATQSNKFLTVSISVLLFMAIATFVGGDVLLGGLIWLFGATAYLIYDRGWIDSMLKSPVSAILGGLLLLISLAGSKNNYVPDAFRDLIVGFAAACFVLTIARYRGKIRFYFAVSTILADGSYTMYLVHFPFMACLVAIFLGPHKFNATFSGYLVFAFLGAVTLIYCYGIYWLFERNTPAIRRYWLMTYRRTTRTSAAP